MNSVIELSNNYRNELKEYLEQWKIDNENEIVKPSWMSDTYKKGELLRHVIAHEIHHIGQLSIWARELGITQISTDFIGRDIEMKVKNL
ncbi:DinB family protein [Paenibacillus sp. GP183]|uniref:DinB family protein n=1 Tax=Paenibacillus sp. GP183 TaxID=1882751 RepID=UPI000A80BCAE|nr:DinB family protein [Paenibacillus sp. GP183]